MCPNRCPFECTFPLRECFFNGCFPGIKICGRNDAVTVRGGGGGGFTVPSWMPSESVLKKVSISIL